MCNVPQSTAACRTDRGYFTGSVWMYTIHLMWSIWGSIISPVAVSSGGSFMMDCLPSGERAHITVSPCEHSMSCTLYLVSDDFV